MFGAHIAKLARSLDRAGIPYMLIGGQAVLVHGEARLTQDIDVTLAAGPERLEDLLALLQGLDWKPLPKDPRTFVEQTLVLPCEDPVNDVKFDFIFGLSRFEQEAIGRALILTVEETPVRFATAEDLVIHKILAGRPRDLEDVKGVLLKNPSLNRSFVEKTLGEFAVDLELPLLETWRTVLKDADPAP